MTTASINPRELLDLVRSPYSDETLAGGMHAVVVDDIGHTDLGGIDAGSLPLVIVGIGPSATHSLASAATNGFDVVVDDQASLAAVLQSIEQHPIASVSLAVLLRASATSSVDHALGAESAVYSTLQSGAEFAAWRARNTPSAAPADLEPAVIAERDDDILRIILNRPHRHNAFSRAMRDALAEMLALAVVDDTIRSVEISGLGPSFCSGGDLGEFGSFGDPASAHMTRLARSPARLMHRLAPRIHVHLHGACMGAGIELAAFGAHVSADPDARIDLPEIGLGLIPGAGGTVSIPRRIGRQRTALLALGGPISAATALSWGLVDEVSPTRARASRP